MRKNKQNSISNPNGFLTQNQSAVGLTINHDDQKQLEAEFITQIGSK